MRTGLKLMIVTSALSMAIGVSAALSGTIALGAGIVFVSGIVAWYAFNKATKEAYAQQEYDAKYRERIDAYTNEVQKGEKV